jgi:CRISPR-associated protein Cas2
MSEIKSSYRMGWFIVFFDLPVGTKEERYCATKFRNNLLDSGYLMLQYSVYVRCAVTTDKKGSLIKELKQISPGTGNVQCVFITDAQWGQTITIKAEDKRNKRSITNETNIGEQLQFW